MVVFDAGLNQPANNSGTKGSGESGTSSFSNDFVFTVSFQSALRPDNVTPGRVSQKDAFRVAEDALTYVPQVFNASDCQGFDGPCS